MKKAADSCLSFTQFTTDEEGFVFFSGVAQAEMDGEEPVEKFFSFHDMADYTSIADGLRFKNTDKTFAELKVHIDDVPELLRRYHKYRNGAQCFEHRS